MTQVKKKIVKKNLFWKKF